MAFREMSDSDPPYDVEKDPYPLMSKWRQSERHSMIIALKEMIDEASRMAKSKRAPAGYMYPTFADPAKRSET